MKTLLLQAWNFLSKSIDFGDGFVWKPVYWIYLSFMFGAGKFILNAMKGDGK
jgi:hypothetical protein